MVNCPNDLMMFQDDVDSLCPWSQQDKMTFITKKKQPFRSSFTINGSVLEDVYEFRDLGLLTNHHLSWNSDVDAITNKANRILGLLRSTCRGSKDTETLKVLFCTFIQRRGTKFILGKRNFTHDKRPKCLHLLSLEKKRYLFDVTFLYKALNGYLNVDVFPFLNFYSQDDPYRLDILMTIP